MLNDSVIVRENEFPISHFNGYRMHYLLFSHNGKKMEFEDAAFTFFRSSHLFRKQLIY